ncbi:hypothetical protein PoHVEF18_006836 [Penicillium ochrochloron]
MSTKMFINHYHVLGVPCDASIKEINSAWKRFALKNHPDKSWGAETTTELFQKGLEAVEILRDPDRRCDCQNRAKYDGRSDGKPGRYKSEAEIDLIFERVKRQERDRVEAERQRNAEWAQAEPETFRHSEQDMHPRGNDSYPCAYFETRPQKAQNEMYKEEIRIQASRDVQNPAARFDKAGEGSSLENLGTNPNDHGVAGEKSTLPHQSTDDASAKPGLCGSSDYNYQVCIAASSRSSDDNSPEPGGVPIADFEALSDGISDESSSEGGVRLVDFETSDEDDETTCY